MTWRVVFEAGTGYRRVFEIGPGKKSTAGHLIEEFRQWSKVAMKTGRCAGFVVAYHLDGPGCDHEVTDGGHAA